MQLINKMSAKAIAGKIPNMVLTRDEDGKPVEFKDPVILASIIGIASDTVTGKTQYGDFVGFTGQFKATNVETGEVFMSSKLFLPNVVTSLLETALKDAGAGNSVEVAFKVGVKGAASQTGYEYTVSPLIEPKTSDILVQLENKISEAAKLPGKKKGE